jgi:hypothetical protein
VEGKMSQGFCQKKKVGKHVNDYDSFAFEESQPIIDTTSTSKVKSLIRKFKSSTILNPQGHISNKNTQYSPLNSTQDSISSQDVSPLKASAHRNAVSGNLLDEFSCLSNIQNVES